MFEHDFRNTDDVLRNEAGCTTVLDYTELTSWLLFSKRWFNLLVLSCIGLQISAPATSQVVAKQGVEDSARIQTFRSPMILEFPASEFIKPTSGEFWRLKGAERFNCEGVYFQYISLARSGKAKKGLEIRIEGTLAVGPSFDREAKVIVEILVDGQSIGTGYKEKIDAEERKTKPFRFSFRLTPEASEILERSRNTVVRVTLFTWEA
jgi:hypothetical protein